MVSIEFHLYIFCFFSFRKPPDFRNTPSNAKKTTKVTRKIRKKIFPPLSPLLSKSFLAVIILKSLIFTIASVELNRSSLSDQKVIDIDPSGKQLFNLELGEQKISHINEFKEIPIEFLNVTTRKNSRSKRYVRFYPEYIRREPYPRRTRTPPYFGPLHLGKFFFVENPIHNTTHVRIYVYVRRQ